MIVFTDYKYKGVGGVGQIVVNTVLELNRKGQTAKVYASHESYEYKRLVEEKAECILIDSETAGLKEFATRLDKEDVIFLTHINNNELLKEIKHINNRLIFYVVHPDTFFIESWFFRLFNFKKKALHLISLLDNKKALLLMDRPNKEAIERRGLTLSEPVKYLTVPINVDQTYKRTFDSVNAKRMITYVGRGNDDWKIYPVIKVLSDLNKMSEEYIFTICTDTDKRFKELIALHVPDNKVKIEYKINLFGHALDDFLKINSWLHISMGTSALEGAKLGIPTILIDYSKSLFPEDYGYKWLYEADGYSLADEILPGMTIKGLPLRQMIKEIEFSNGYNTVADQCFDYVLNNHSLDVFLQRVLEACQQTEMTVKDYCNTSLHTFLLYIKPLYTYSYLGILGILHPKKAIKKIIKIIYGK